ncbi:packaging ATPase [Saline Natrinema sp. J7-1 virus 1]|uniref:Packaging ATPase n=1 Tax=Saline Natrinema sp. J7-1 virus 1 TaxID=2847285 RepID=A0AAE9VPR5_9VIRU|nr:packaging ATPase [Saline Natrinema sp. J7-1 virus 1]WBE14027.1 packaging ATPase [Saline Natrinema sp. J7-1 virus 1]
MSRVGFAATSGWGKGYNAQAWMEANLPDVDFAAVLDYKDEYRGLVKGTEPSRPETDLCSWFIAGPDEVEKPVAFWRTLIEQAERVIIPRYRIDGDEWRQVCGNVAAAMRQLFEDHPKSSSLLAIDEAHAVAPQRGSYPEAIKKAAKVGRGEGLSTLWITQELQDIDNRIIGMWTDTILGGFRTEAALDALSIEYPAAIHNTNLKPSQCPSLPSELQVNGEDLPLRKFTDDAGDITGSEWVYALEGGEIERVNTANVTMHSHHYGNQGESLESPYS